jgi:NAD(P)-dependent dehydrogenase (short-subunit alcohol dehydrogenase family)
MINIDLTGKTALITGGGRGLGKQIAITLAKAGANIYIGNRKEEQGLETVEELKKLGVEAGFTSVDVAKEDQVEKFFKDGIEFGKGKIDFVINNAGIVELKSLDEIKGEEMGRVFDVNVTGTAIVIKHALAQMSKQKYGRIVTVSSIAGINGMGMLELYSASKAAVVNLTKNAAVLGAKDHINVNSIAPGIIRTSMWEEILDSMDTETSSEDDRNKNFDDSVKQFIPFGNAQTEQDIANAALFLVSDLSKEITGVVLPVDGGTSI